MVINTQNHGYYQIDGQVATKIIYDENSEEWLFFENYTILDPTDSSKISKGSVVELFNEDEQYYAIVDVIGVLDISLGETE